VPAVAADSTPEVPFNMPVVEARFSSLPVVESNRTISESTELAGPVTSPLPVSPLAAKTSQ
jgi:hypothetical protein